MENVWVSPLDVERFMDGNYDGDESEFLVALCMSYLCIRALCDDLRRESAALRESIATSRILGKGGIDVSGK